MKTKTPIDRLRFLDEPKLEANALRVPSLFHVFASNAALTLVGLIEIELESDLTAQIAFGLDERGQFFPLALALVPDRTAFPVGPIRALLRDPKCDSVKTWVARKRDGFYRIQNETQAEAWILDPKQIRLTHSVQERFSHLRAIFISAMILKWVEERKANIPFQDWGTRLEGLLTHLASEVNQSVRKNPVAHSSVQRPSAFDTEGYEAAERAKRRFTGFAIASVIGLAGLAALGIFNIATSMNADYDRGLASAKAGNHLEATHYLEAAVAKHCSADAPCVKLRLPLAQEYRKLGDFAAEKKVLEIVFRRGTPTEFGNVRLCEGWSDLVEAEGGRLDVLKGEIK